MVKILKQNKTRTLISDALGTLTPPILEFMEVHFSITSDHALLVSYLS